jgi:ATP-dependent Lon protease
MSKTLNANESSQTNIDSKKKMNESKTKKDPSITKKDPSSSITVNVPSEPSEPVLKPASEITNNIRDKVVDIDDCSKETKETDDKGDKSDEKQDVERENAEGEDPDEEVSEEETNVIKRFFKNIKTKYKERREKKSDSLVDELDNDDNDDADFIDDDGFFDEENPLEGWIMELNEKNEEDKKIIDKHQPLLEKMESYLPKFAKILKSQLTDEEKEECLWKVAVLNNANFDEEYVNAMLKLQKKLDYSKKMDKKDFEKYKYFEDKFKDVEFEKPMKNKIFDLPVDDNIKRIIYRHYLQNSLNDSKNENEKETKWLETVMSIPWGKYVDIDIPEPKKIMEEWGKEVSGLIPAKEEFILTLTDYVTNPSINPKILTLKGVPGCGKTLFVQSISKILKMPVQWIDLAGMNEVNFIKGFAKTWEGSKIGRLAEAIINMQSFNGIIVLEEIDKVNSGTTHGKETLDSLVPILDRTRNHAYYDNYLSDIPMPLNNVIFIATCNEDKEFPQYLLDRLNIMNIESPDMNEKLNRARNFMIPAALRERNLSSEDVIINDDVVRYIIEHYTLKEGGKPEGGVRTLKERLQSIIQRINYFKRELEKQEEKEEKEKTGITSNETLETLETHEIPEMPEPPVEMETPETPETTGKKKTEDKVKSSLAIPKDFALPFKVERWHVDDFLQFQKEERKNLGYFM